MVFQFSATSAHRKPRRRRRSVALETIEARAAEFGVEVENGDDDGSDRSRSIRIGEVWYCIIGGKFHQTGPSDNGWRLTSVSNALEYVDLLANR